MSRKPQTRSKATNEEEPSVHDQTPSIDIHELENTLNSFNLESTKLDICKQIKVLESLIQEETVKDSENNEETLQTILLPSSGKRIQAKGNSLKHACELVEAWSKSTRTTSQTADVRQSPRLERSRPTTGTVPKFAVVA